LGTDHENAASAIRPPSVGGRAHVIARSSAASWAFPCIVGTGDATEKVRNGTRHHRVVRRRGLSGNIYYGRTSSSWSTTTRSPTPSEPKTAGHYERRDSRSCVRGSRVWPNDGVGLARLEFIINNHIGNPSDGVVNYPNLKSRGDIETIANRILEEDPKEFFVRSLAEGVGRIAAAFYPKPVIVRMSDFKSNEYAMLVGGREFEPVEENPMIGFRGASRYYDDRYKAGFRLECLAMVRAREDMGLTNIKPMIPFCRTVEEGEKVIALMAEYGLVQGENELEIYAMCELPANVVFADEFLQVFDGYLDRLERSHAARPRPRPRFTRWSRIF
jgi:pyruvate,water dikinase